MTITKYYLENKNSNEITIFTERKIFGENWVKDKTTHHLDVFIQFKNEKWEVVECCDYYDEELGDVVEDNVVIECFDSREQALIYAINYFNIKEKRE